MWKNLQELMGTLTGKVAGETSGVDGNGDREGSKRNQREQMGTLTGRVARETRRSRWER
jgi:hypothetical protein